GVAFGILAWSIRLGNLPNYVATTGVLAGLGAVFGFVVAVHYWLMPTGTLTNAVDPAPK
ncbi:MAG: hypothetical protein IT173_11680, partial [Acidobacteria bacterium]|nr:hypothetical protein [Acidobacteriota bacterium]